MDGPSIAGGPEQDGHLKMEKTRRQQEAVERNNGKMRTCITSRERQVHYLK